MGVQVAPLPISNTEDLMLCFLVFSLDGTAWETVPYHPYETGRWHPNQWSGQY